MRISKHVFMHVFVHFRWITNGKNWNISVIDDTLFSTCICVLLVYSFFLILLLVYENIKMQLNSQNLFYFKW